MNEKEDTAAVERARELVKKLQADNKRAIDAAIATQCQFAVTAFMLESKPRQATSPVGISVEDVAYISSQVIDKERAAFDIERKALLDTMERLYKHVKIYIPERSPFLQEIRDYFKKYGRNG